jgi:hypothetical protein
MVRGTVEETLNALLDAEADRLCGAGRYERTQVRQDTLAGSYERSLHTVAGEAKAGEVRNVSLRWPRPSIRKDFARSWGSARAPRRTNTGWSAFLRHLLPLALHFGVDHLIRVRNRARVSNGASVMSLGRRTELLARCISIRRLLD